MTASLAGTDFWGAARSGRLRPLAGNPNEFDAGDGLTFIPKFKEFEGEHGATVRVFDGGTLYAIKGKGDYTSPASVFDANGNPTNEGFSIEHKAPGFLDNYGWMVPLAIAGGAAALGVGAPGAAGATATGATTAPVAGATGALTGTELAAVGAEAGALDLGGGIVMTAEGGIVGATGAFVPATAAEMTAMTGGGLAAASTGASALGTASSIAQTVQRFAAPVLNAVRTLAGGSAAQAPRTALVPGEAPGGGQLIPFEQSADGGQNMTLLVALALVGVAVIVAVGKR